MREPGPSPSEAKPRSGRWSGLGQLASTPLWARLVLLTAAGLISLINHMVYGLAVAFVYKGKTATSS